MTENSQPCCFACKKPLADFALVCRDFNPAARSVNYEVVRPATVRETDLVLHFPLCEAGKGDWMRGLFDKERS